MPLNTMSPGQCMEQELRLTGQLIEALQQEESALLRNDVDLLQSSTQAKSRLVSEFFEAHRRRLASLVQLGLEGSDRSMLQWLESRGDAQARALWGELLQQLAQARELNRTNGLMINQLSARNLAAMQVLRPAGPASLYGPSGQKTIRSTFGSSLG